MGAVGHTRSTSTARKRLITVNHPVTEVLQCANQGEHQNVRRIGACIKVPERLLEHGPEKPRVMERAWLPGLCAKLRPRDRGSGVIAGMPLRQATDCPLAEANSTAEFCAAHRVTFHQSAGLKNSKP